MIEKEIRDTISSIKFAFFFIIVPGQSVLRLLVKLTRGFTRIGVKFLIYFKIVTKLKHFYLSKS